MKQIMASIRENGLASAGIVTESVKDYKDGIDGLPASDVLKYTLPDGCTIVIRPSGTEPKLKVYMSVRAEDEESANAEEKRLSESVRQLFV